MLDYSKYGYFGHLCEVPQDVLNNLISYYDILEKTEADQNNTYYKQWRVQSTSLRKEVDNGYIVWEDNGYLDITKRFFETYVNEIFRFRFSWLQKNKEVKYHVNHMLPRIHIPLNDSGSVFVVKDNDIEYSYNLEFGSAHFINVTLPHKVIGTKDMHRKNSFFSFETFKDKNIEAKFLK